MATQLDIARSGTISEEVKSVAEAENVDAELIRDELAAGRLAIPANKLHLKTNLAPAGIGRVLRTKVNANIGTSNVRSSAEAELEKMRAALDAGADAMMDLSTGGNLDEIRAQLLAQCPVPFGTVPIYQIIEDRAVEDIDVDTILEIIEKQAKQGVDFFTIHAGVLREHLPLLEKRVAGIVSRGGALLAKWMLHHNRQNPLYEMFPARSLTPPTRPRSRSCELSASLLNERRKKAVRSWLRGRVTFLSTRYSTTWKFSRRFVMARRFTFWGRW
jgi:phosphomethylpyrimidine synthase